jgi:hypothetical protein
MKGVQKIVAAALVTAGSLAASSAMAQVDPHADREGASVGVLLGYGFNDGYHLGLGVRGGYTLAQKIYIGGTFVYNFGNDNVSLFYVGPEGGYDFVIPSAPQVMIRPYLGLGLAEAHFSGETATAGGVTVSVPGASSGGFAFWPGVSGFYSFNENWSGGLDARVIVDTDGDGDTAFALALTGQYKF